MLQFGTYDLAAQTPAGRLISNEYFLDAYAGTAPDRAKPDISPLFAELTGLPPILIVIGTAIPSASASRLLRISLPAAEPM